MHLDLGINVNGLINGGIVDKLLKKLFRYDFKDLDVIEDQQLLVTLNDLMIIFFVCIIGFSASILVYITELYVYKVKIYLIKNDFINYGTILDTKFIDSVEVSF